MKCLFFCINILFIYPAYSTVTLSITGQNSDSAKAELYIQMSDSLIKIGNYEEALNCYHNAREIFIKLNDFEQYVNYSNQAGWVLAVYLNRANEAITLLQSTLNEVSAKMDSSENAFLRLFNSLGAAYLNEGIFEKALSCFSIHMELNIRKYGKDNKHVATSMHNIGNVYYDLSDYDKAQSYYLEALEIRNKVLPKDHQHFGMSYLNLGNIYFEKADYQMAEKFFEMALSVLIKNYSENNIDVAGVYNNLGMIYYARGDYYNAIDFHLHSHYIKEKNLPPGHIDMHESLQNLGAVYGKLNEFEKARNCFLKSVSLSNEHPDKNHLETFKSYINLAIVDYETQDYNSALVHLDTASNIINKNLGFTNNDIALISKVRGNIFRALEDSLKSMEHYNAALSGYRKTYSYKHPHICETLLEIAKLHKHNPEIALMYYQEALISILPNFSESDIYMNPPLEKFMNIQNYRKAAVPIELFETLAEKAEAFWVKGQQDY